MTDTNKAGGGYDWSGRLTAMAAVVTAVVALVVSAGGWGAAREHPAIWVPVFAAACLVIIVHLGSASRRAIRARRIWRAAQASPSELAFQSGVYGEGRYKLGKGCWGTVGMRAVMDAATVRWGNSVVSVDEIVDWLKQGAPNRITGQ